MERHPGPAVLLAHGGGAVLALRGRLRHAHEHIAGAQRALREPVEDSLRRFYYDTITHDPAVLRALVDFVGAERVLAGSDHPFDMGDPDPAATVRAAGLDAEAEAAILGGNAEGCWMSADAQIVVAGAGHNSLITAAYLALAGYEVLVLDARAIPGGGAASEELLGPGYMIDSCSTGHTLIQTNPLLVDDELGLLGRYGLEYLQPDPFAHVAFPDGDAPDGVARPRAHVRGDRALLEAATPPPTGARSTSTTRSSTSSPPASSRRPASARRSSSCSPSTRADDLAAAEGDERVGRHPPRVRGPRTSRRSCSGRPTRRSCRSSPTAPGSSRTRSSSAASGARGRSRAAARAR